MKYISGYVSPHSLREVFDKNKVEYVQGRCHSCSLSFTDDDGGRRCVLSNIYGISYNKCNIAIGNHMIVKATPEQVEAIINYYDSIANMEMMHA